MVVMRGGQKEMSFWPPLGSSKDEEVRGLGHQVKEKGEEHEI